MENIRVTLTPHLPGLLYTPYACPTRMPTESNLCCIYTHGCGIHWSLDLSDSPAAAISLPLHPILLVCFETGFHVPQPGLEFIM